MKLADASRVIDDDNVTTRHDGHGLVRHGEVAEVERTRTGEDRRILYLTLFLGSLNTLIIGGMKLVFPYNTGLLLGKSRPGELHITRNASSSFNRLSERDIELYFVALGGIFKLNCARKSHRPGRKVMLDTARCDYVTFDWRLGRRFCFLLGGGVNVVQTNGTLTSRYSHSLLIDNPIKLNHSGL